MSRRQLVANILLLAALSLAACAQRSREPSHVVTAPQQKTAALPLEIPVFVVRYFPVRGERIDQAVTGDWDAPLDETAPED